MNCVLVCCHAASNERQVSSNAGRLDESAVFHCDFATKCQTGAKRYGDPKRFAWKVREGKLSTAGVDKEGVMLKRFELEAETVDSDIGMALAQCCAREAAVRWHSARI